MLTKALQAMIVLTPCVLFAWLLYADINPTGTFEVYYEMGDVSPYIDRLLPDDRLSGLQKNAAGDRYFTMQQDPVYFSIHAPHTLYDDVEVEIAFRNEEQPILEFGPLTNIFSQAYDLRPLHNLIIEDSSWSSMTQGGVTLLQRRQDFESVSDFFDRLPSTGRIATYAYDLNAPYRIADYTPLGSTRVIDVSLRGFHKYVTYIKNEDFVLDVQFMDMNRKNGADEVVIRVWNEAGDVVHEEKMADDGNDSQNQYSTRLQANVRVPDLPEGVYTVELSGTSDIFWRKLQTPQRYVTFVNQLYIGDDVGYLADPRRTSFYTNAKHVVLETFHADATQAVTIGSTDIPLPRSHEKAYVSVEGAGVLYGATPRGDVKIVGDGKFAFSSDAFFDPDPIALTALTDVDARDIDYIVTSYTLPTVGADGWERASATFALTEVLREDGSATFTISAPSMETLQTTADIHSVTLRFKKDPLAPGEFFSALRERLPFGL